MKVGILIDPTTIKAKILIDGLKNRRIFEKKEIFLIFPSGYKHTDLDYALRDSKFLKENDLSSEEDVKFLKDFDFLITFGWPFIVCEKAVNSLSPIINIHGGKLPDYRGGSVYYHMWAHLEKIGSTTAHILVKSVDAGDIISSKSFNISFWDSPKDILKKSSNAGIDLLIEIIDKKNKNIPKKQKTGRYFYPSPIWKLVLYRIVNIIIATLGKKIILPHKLQ